MTTELRRIQLRRGTASDWSTLNPVLAQGELGLEHDTGVVKIGDGSTAWNSLPVLAKTTEEIQDIVGAMVVAGTNVAATYNDGAGTLTLDVPNENIDDRVAALLVAGSNITLTYNDVSNSLTIASTGGGGGGGTSTVSKATLGLPLLL